MKLTTRQDIEAPVAFVYKVLTDFEWWERSAMRRGADVSRTDTLRQPGPGMSWIAKFFYRGRDRNVTVRVDAMDATVHLAMSAFSPVLEGQCRIDLVEMSARRTRLHLHLDLKPKSLGARLYFQSLRLARARVERSLAQRTAAFAADIEARLKRETA